MSERRPKIDSSAAAIRKRIFGLLGTITDETEEELKIMEDAEQGDPIAQAWVTADEADFERDVNEPVRLIAEYENKNEGKRITPEQLKKAMEEAGYSHVDTGLLEETINAYYGTV